MMGFEDWGLRRSGMTALVINPACNLDLMHQGQYFFFVFWDFPETSPSSLLYRSNGNTSLMYFESSINFWMA
ncbi:MAG: hypothetical protein OTJ43_00370 [Dehalococcoidia bacterium]|nr:hypothetical protein [Dehalococcoidia bacterium]